MSRPSSLQIMGVLNVTPDSFSDGGQFIHEDAAVERGLAMLTEGADWIDVGGESTRPGADPVSADEERTRTEPVVRRLVQAGARVSIDTQKPEVAQAALDEGATMVNDVNGLRDRAMLELVVQNRCAVCIMHMKGTPRTMQHQPTYRDVVADVTDFLVGQATTLVEAGLPTGHIWIDPGIGFGKTVEQNLELLRHTDRLVETGFPVLIGVSRKSFLGAVGTAGDDPLPVTERLAPTLAVQTAVHLAGARMVRVHDVKEAFQVALTTQALIGNGRNTATIES